MINPSKDHENCQKCGLWEGCHSPFMEFSGQSKPRVLIVGEAPSPHDDREDMHFVGQSGKKLKDVLTMTGIADERIAYTHVVKCRPPENKVTKAHIKHCFPFLEAEIEELDPEVVVLLGNVPLNSVLGKSGITNWNGVTIERDDRIYVPLLHPSYVLRDPSNMDDWLQGMLNIVDALAGKIYSEQDKLNYIYPKSIQDLKDMRDYLADFEWIAYDTETTSLNPYSEASEVIVVSLAGGENTYAYPTNHPENWWSDEEYDEVVAILAEILHGHAGKLIGQNMKFDWQWTKEGLGIEYETGADTMLMSHLYDTRKGIHGLKRNAGLHLGMYDYDKELNDYIYDHPEANPYKGGSYANIPLETLLPYAAMDTHATLLLFDVFYEKLTPKQNIFHEQGLVKISDYLSRMEYNGIKVDKFVANRYHEIYTKIADRYYLDIIAEDEVVETVAQGQEDCDVSLMAAMLDVDATHDVTKAEVLARMDSFEFTDTEVIAIGDAEAEMIENNPRKHRTRSRNIFEFNPNSTFHMRRLVIDVCGVSPKDLPQTDTGAPSLDADALEALKDDIPIVAHLLSWKLLKSMVSKYLKSAAIGKWESDDGLVRSNYNMHISKTGRLTSTDPNMQNIPTPESRPGTLCAYMPIKNIFTSRYKNGLIVSIDYSGAELRVFACIANVPGMLDIHKSGKDFHTMVSTMVSGIPYDEVPKEVRYVYKWTNWTLLYGGDEYTLHSLYDIPMEKAVDTVKQYYKQFPEVLDYQKDCTRFAEDNGYIESIFGRRLQLHYINDRRKDVRGHRGHDRRTAINMPIQSVASDMTALAGAVIDAEMRKKPEVFKKSLAINTVHDSHVYDTVPEELDALVELAVGVMENIKDYAKDYYPDIDFSWLKCPLVADVEVGSHYGNEIPYEEWKKEFA
jgi:uracil-DNA glycosylase family 4